MSFKPNGSDLDDFDLSDDYEKDLINDPKNSDRETNYSDNDNQAKDSVTTDDAPVVTEKSEDSLKQNTAEKSKFFAIRISGGQENIVANSIINKIRSKKVGLFSVLLLENFKGYIIVEAPDSNVVFDALYGIRHIRGQIRGELPYKDIEGYLVKKPVAAEFHIEDVVEVIAGPFKSMKAKIVRMDHEKQEATVVLLDSPYQIPVTVDANYLRKLSMA